MAVRYRPVADGALVAGTTTVYTVPADRTLVLKRCTFFCTTGAAGQLQLLVRPTAASGSTVVGNFSTPVANTTYGFDIANLVLSEGGLVQFFLPATVVGRYVISGSLLAGDPA